MEEIIKQSYSDTTDIEDIERGRYHLFTSDNQIILPKLWERLVSPGMEIKLKIWRKPRQDEASNAAKETNKEEKAPVSFQEATGKRHYVPWNRACSWQVSNLSNLSLCTSVAL